MSWLKRMFHFIPSAEALPQKKPSHLTIPTVKFDISNITGKVKADIRKNVERIEWVDRKHFDEIYEVALQSVSEGGNLSTLFNGLMLMKANGMTRKKATQITHMIHKRATAIITREQQIKLGVTDAKWKYSGAPCDNNPRSTTDQQNSCHASADNQHYKVSEGMFLDGKWTWPGYEDGCKCYSQSIIVGFID
jgi:hypothetical protein